MELSEQGLLLDWAQSAEWAESAERADLPCWEELSERVGWVDGVEQEQWMTDPE